jgi:hypothetical protein
MLDVNIIREAYGFELWIAPTVEKLYCRFVQEKFSKYDLS